VWERALLHLYRFLSMESTARAIARFQTRFGASPQWVASAPGRVNLIGEHTDYSDGFVLPMAIEPRTALAAAPRADRIITLHSAAFDETVTFDLGQPLSPRPAYWSNYAAGVIAGIEELGVSVPGFDAVLESDVPLGAGLSSSAAFEVATATLIEAAAGMSWTPRDKARLCQRAEHRFAGVPTGIMDQLIAVVARPDHAVLIDCRSLDATYVDLADPGVTVLIVNSNVRHRLADGAYADRRAASMQAAERLGVAALRDATVEQVEAEAERLGPVLYPRARHVVSENRRVCAAAEAFRSRHWREAGTLMYQSHASLRDDFMVSCPELDALVEIAQGIGVDGGVFGCRMTGGGFGGSVVAIVRSDAVGPVGDTMSRQYVERTGRSATVMTSRPGGGAYTASIP
jgi:galactokinase